ncbi:poly(ADP-ribose) glycohydrolase [Entomortierella parvispora]|uniref:poly(ADP-ribose) glycohydrolase n=1 Tax=Entomortierella parvispora TaxID=205924 RepID=A0A9P3H4C3_9FUNG|nr:poly(ADP-ribose) glycohydrolase [Entomortierella parvispora]
MTIPVYFETGPHHVLCQVPGLDPIKFPYPDDFEDCWDHHHVRLPCSSRTPSTSEKSTWPDIVQGLTTTINNSKELDTIMARWNGGGGNSSDWNIRALSVFLNRRADSQKTATSSSQFHARRAGNHGPMSLSFLNNPEENSDQRESDIESNDGSNLSDIDDDEGQFLSEEERTRFFDVVLPKMQALALRLPELVKKPIPFLDQQVDSAVTLRQEQIACLLANAFFCTFPQRNSSRMNQHHGADKKRKATDTKNIPEKKKTLGQAPKDPYGNASQGDSRKAGDPFRNTNGQMSLFAYFNKSEQRPAPEPSEKPTSDNHESQSMSQGPSTDQPIRVDREPVAQKETKKPIPRLPSINFSSLYSSDNVEDPCSNVNAAKLRCLVHYFDRVTSEMPQGAVTFHRQVLMTPLTLETSERISKRRFRYSNVRVDPDSPLEDEAPPDALQLDFANKVIGGGVLGHGSVQEEIRFMISPELIVSRLFTKTLQNNEALLIKGAERFSNYNGYARTFEWHSDHRDATSRDRMGRRKTEICAIDAVPFRSKEARLDQFSSEFVMREISKAIVGFRRSPITASEWGLCRPEEPMRHLPLIATGNWGCGAFGGHLELKFLIQLLAASVCQAFCEDDKDVALGRDLVYYTYGLDDLGKEIEEFMGHLHACPTAFEPVSLLECIEFYPIKSGRGKNISLRESSLLNYVGKAFGFPSTLISPTMPEPLYSSSSLCASTDSYLEEGEDGDDD